MKKIIFGYIGGFISFLIVVIIMVNLIISGINKEQNRFKNAIGSKVILGKDTLTVVDYSTIFETFTLSNGKTVAESFVNKNKP